MLISVEVLLDVKILYFMKNKFFILDFGQRVSGLSGNIIFNPFLNSASGVTHSYWLIQVPAVRTVYLTIASPPKCAIDGTTQLQVYQGPAANGKSVKSVCRDGTFTPVVDLMKGPFISLILVTRNLTNSGFIVYFDVNRPGKCLFCVLCLTTIFIFYNCCSIILLSNLLNFF